MNKTYWIHRTTIAPLTLNPNSKNNKLPTLISNTEYVKLLNEGIITNKIDDELILLPNDLWLQKKEVDEINKAYIDILQKNGITKKEYLEAREKNYREQLNSFFNNGLYIQRNQIKTTATFLGYKQKDAEKEMEKILQQENFGFQKKISTILSDRQEMNACLILEIPEHCTSGTNPEPIFEDAIKPITMFTAYFGPQELKKIIPTQYIKSAYMANSTNTHTKFDNPYYDSKYVVKQGLYDEDALEKYFENQLSKDFNLENIKKLANFIEKNFEKTKEKFFIYKLEQVVDLVNKNNISPETQKAYSEINQQLSNCKKSLMSPIELLSTNLMDTDLENLSAEKTAKELLNYITSVKQILRENFQKDPYSYFSADDFLSIQSAMECIKLNYYYKLRNTPYYNDTFGKVGLFDKVLSMKQNIFNKIQSLQEEEYNLDIYNEEKETLSQQMQQIEQKDNTLKKQLIFINYAICSDLDISEKIKKFIQETDLSQLTHKDCLNIVIDIVKKQKYENNQQRCNNNKDLEKGKEL